MIKKAIELAAAAAITLFLFKILIKSILKDINELFK